jgi:cardiolipin synthase
MITDFGKMIDPVVDKLTQGAILIALALRFPLMLLPILVMAIKEALSLVIRARLFRATGEVYGARWHGKANTVLLYSVLCAHIMFPDLMQGTVSAVSIFISSAMMIISFALYTAECSEHLKKNKK